MVIMRDTPIFVNGFCISATIEDFLAKFAIGEEAGFALNCALNNHKV